MFPRARRNFDTAKHSRQFFNTLIFFKVGDGRPGRLAIADFENSKMVIREAGNLRQVSNAKYLSRLTEFTQFQTDHFGDPATNTAVHFVKYHGWNRAAVAGNYLNG